MTLQQDAQSWTIRDLMKFSINYLQRHGFDETRLTSELLLAHALQCQRIELYTNFEKPLSKEELKCFRSSLERRLSHEPVQYIVGSTSFMGLQFLVDRRVFIPRPETETLVEQVMMVCRSEEHGASASILEVGTGSGNIAVALAKLLREVHVTTIDTSEDALAVARENAVAHSVVDRVTLVRHDIFSPAEPNFHDRYDLLVSNPPYVSETEWSSLQPEVRQFEPRTAVSDLGDGYKFYRRLAEIGPYLLRDGGSILLEVGAGQADTVQRVLEETHFSDFNVVEDLQNIPRVVVGVWRGR